MSYWYPVQKELVLASRSPRRTEILTMAGVPHIIHPSEVKESFMEGPPEGVVVHWAAKKAADVSTAFPDHPVLGADTMVYQNGLLMGKPSDRDEAVKMVTSLSGNWHDVFGGVALVWKSRGISFSFHEATRVRFRELHRDEIEAYVDSGEPMDKAGAYGIQGLGSLLVDRVDGSYFNVMGLPVAQLLSRFRNSLK
ncbi:septum formation protein Maf [Candidatus Fermentibacteria bacterium]|nr:MAG: septum formation protein Maf [Candidatus Fermentibacteria bacterium]